MEVKQMSKVIPHDKTPDATGIFDNEAVKSVSSPQEHLSATKKIPEASTRQLNTLEQVDGRSTV